MHNLLWDHLEEIGQIAENQWGFTHGKSTVTALLSTFNSVYQYMERGCDVALLFLDISKAFDSVPHVPLLQHLRDIGLNQFLLQWIAYYLFKKKQHVVVNGESSTDTSVVSGVPQGSVLGPLLFLSYINSISHLPLSNGAQMTLYADDILLIKPICETNDYMLLQEDMTNIANEIEKLHLTLNTSKCKYIVGSRKRQPLLPPGGLFINGSVIEQVENYCYLGVMVNQHICWSEHIQHLCRKVRKLIGMLYRNFYTWADTSTLRTVYITCIRPHLEYAAQLWDPYKKKDMDNLESVQKFACKVCLKTWDMNYEDMLHSLNLMPLQTRRKYLKLVTIFNIINGHLHFNPGNFTPQQPAYNSRQTSQFNFYRPYGSVYYPAILNLMILSNLNVENVYLSRVSVVQ